MSVDELKELLELPNYSWVKEDLLPAYHVLSKMRSEQGNGYQFLPTSEENLLLNLKGDIKRSDLIEFEQVFANWVDKEEVEEGEYRTANVYHHKEKYHSGTDYKIRITVTGSLLNIGKEQLKMRKGEWSIEKIQDLLFFKYLLSNTNVKAIEDTGFLSVITKDEMWDEWGEGYARYKRSTKNLVRNLVLCNKAFLSDVVLETITSELLREEFFYECMDSIPGRCKAAEHHFNSVSCHHPPRYRYAVPSEIWSEIRTKIESIDYASVIRPSLSKMEEGYVDILNETKFLEILKNEKVDANNRMKTGDYESFSDVIERLNMDGVIKIAPTRDIILLVEEWTINTRINSLGEEIAAMISRWLNEAAVIREIPKPPIVGPKPVPDGEAKGDRSEGKKGDGIKVLLGDDVFWKPGSLNNGHFIIIGGSGAGKTETIRCIASELEKQKYPVLMIDFHGDMACKNCNMETYEMKEDSKYYFNPLELDPKFKEITPLRANSDFVDAMLINFPNLGIQQKDDLRDIIKKSYDEVGITTKKETWNKELKFKDIENKIKRSEDKTTQTLKAYLADVFDYELFSGSEKLSVGDILEGGVTHLNLKLLPESLRSLFADLFLRKLYYTVMAMGDIPKGTGIPDKEKFRLFVIVDEAKLLVSEKQGTKAVLNKYATDLRKYGVGLILASQLIAHFTNEIPSNIAVKLCMKAESKKQAKENNKYFEVGETEIQNLKQGEGILIGNCPESVKIKIKPTWKRRSQEMEEAPDIRAEDAE